MLRLGLSNRSDIEKAVWHGTAKSDPKLIYEDEQDGFDMTFSNSGMWGRGLYFAENASYSVGLRYSGDYSHDCGDGTHSVMLVKLLEGESKHMPSDRTIKRPPAKEGTSRRYNTVTGETCNSKVYIVYENGPYPPPSPLIALYNPFCAIRIGIVHIYFLCVSIRI